MTTLAERIDAALRWSGVSQARVAREMGISPGYLRRIRKEGIQVRADKLLAIANATGVSADYLLGRVDAPEAVKFTAPKNPDEDAATAIGHWFLNLPRRQQEAILALAAGFEDSALALGLQTRILASRDTNESSPSSGAAKALKRRKKPKGNG